MEPDQGWPSLLSWEKPELGRGRGVGTVFSQDVRSSSHKSLALPTMALSLGNPESKWVNSVLLELSFSCLCHPGKNIVACLTLEPA